jgi:hypothetical protein
VMLLKMSLQDSQGKVPSLRIGLPNSLRRSCGLSRNGGVKDEDPGRDCQFSVSFEADHGIDRIGL